MMILPVNNKQKFQVGDICRISRLGWIDVNICYPPKTELCDELKDRECIILHTYSQVYWGSDYKNYSVYLIDRGNQEYIGSYAWIEECQLDFVRKPNKTEVNIVIENDKIMLEYDNCPYTSILDKMDNEITNLKSTIERNIIYEDN